MIIGRLSSVVRRPSSVRPSASTIDFFSETARPISLKFGREVPGDNLTQVCSNGGATCLFLFFTNFFSKIFKNLLLQNHLSDLVEIWFVDSS